MFVTVGAQKPFHPIMSWPGVHLATQTSAQSTVRIS
jgi:hypothetical protein